MHKFSKISLIFAASSMSIMPLTPAIAAENIMQSAVQSSDYQPILNTKSSDADYHRRYYRHRHHRDRIDAGDIITGAIILGGIAILANSGKNKRQSEPRYPDDRYDYPNENDRYDNRSQNNAPYEESSNEIGDAISTCSRAVEQQNSARINNITMAQRDGNGWRVEGEISSDRGDLFICGTSNGRVDFVQYR
ncbi:hypothetical protein LPB140_04875 [Sphingorhabdus lutea]|uniref:Secreted protein n=1 Tax=Sphingorhabdus lutea TaxID=1913578 RepID=A0A1L3JAT0_9SPHN|nr:hypothetical protein [Sphingorhabdus lutea]APG62244.1 hypothetical protein LPB140_04875 [Sphingorhabdus lutea]